VLSNFGSYSTPTSQGKAYGIGLFTPTVTIDPAVSNTVDLKAWTFDFSGAGDGHSTPRAGYGIVFEIDPASPCPGAFLYGRDPTPLLSDPTDAYVSGATVYEYTDVYKTPYSVPPVTNWWPPDEANGGVAMVQLNAGTCPGGTVLVDVYIPSDAEAIPFGLGSWGRFPDRLNAPSPIVARVSRGLTGISINNPDPTYLLEGATVRITATCTYDSPPYSDDCSDPRAGGIVCVAAGSITLVDDCVILAPDIPCGDTPQGTVTAWAVADVSLFDSISIIGQENDFIVYQELMGPMVEIYDGQEFCWGMIAHWSDGCMEEVPTFTSYVTGDCYQTGPQCAIGSTGACYIWDPGANNSPVIVPIL